MQEVKKAEDKYYELLDKIPYNRFVDCYVDSNLSALVISGFPQTVDLEKAWDNIFFEYIERVGNSEYKLYLDLYKEISRLRITLSQIDTIVGRGNKEEGTPPGILRLCYDEYFAKEINKILGTNCRFNWKDPKSYFAEVDKCLNRASGLRIRRDLLLSRFEAIEKKNEAQRKGSAKKIDRAYFTSVLVTLSDIAKYNLPETISMGEYCERLKRCTS